MSEQPEKIISDDSDVGSVSEKPEYQPEQIRRLTERTNGAWKRATGVSGPDYVN